MENMRINVRQAHSDTYNGNPYIAFKEFLAVS